MASNITESEFNMWRAVFAFTFVDSSLSLEEQELLAAYMKKVPFTPEQIDILKEDMENPDERDVVQLYKRITRKQDKERFCVLCRAIVWSEGDMDAQERKILKKVSCLKDDVDEILSSTRDDARLNDYYQYYAKSGMLGLMKAPPALQRIA
jgi:hypothetical protein